MPETSESSVLAGLSFTREAIEQSLPARFEQVAALFPDRPALSGNGQSWSYAALNGQANRIAHAIRANARPGIGCVAFLLDQSPEMVIATLAVLKAAKIYLGIHPGMPATAQRAILRDAAPDLILATAALGERAREIAAGVCQTLILEEIDKRFGEENPQIPIRPEEPSTIFYTSGTTGHPKGVVKSHRAVMHRVWLSAQHDRIVPEDRQSLLTHCAFSASESDMFGVLLQGGTLCVFNAASQSLAAFRAWIDEERITLLHPPVLLFRSLLETLEGSGLFPSVRLVALAGDVVAPGDLERWRRRFSPSCVLLHRFSTSETALLTVARFDRDSVVDPNFVAAGCPVADKCLELVDEAGRPVARSESGELAVRSRYISDGYWRHPDETAAAFQPAPDFPGERIYRTGDLGRFLPDGSLVFLGRREHLAKIRGYRVDTREVESALAQLEGVTGAAVIVRKEHEQDRLWAFVVMKPEAGFDARRLREELRALLPEWKIPARLESIPALPATLNGKVDRQLLAKFADRGNAEPETLEIDRDNQDAASAGIEKELADIWRVSLRVDRVGRDDNFLDMGGDSISAMVTLNSIERRYGIRLTAAAFFEHATVRRLAALLEDRLGVSGSVSARLYDLVRAQAERNPDAFAILAHGRKPLTYSRFRRHLDEVVKTLRSRGIGRNDRVAMALPSGPEAAVATIAVASAATCAPLNPGYREGEFAFALADLNCKALLAPEGSASAAVAAARKLRVPILEVAPLKDAEAGIFALRFSGTVSPHLDAGFAEPDDIALALHTSGTAARPKIAPLTHANICAAAYSILDAVELMESDRCLSVMPLFHIHGLSAVFASLAAGGSVVCPGDFSAGEFQRSMEEFRPTWYTAAPALHRTILENAPFDSGIVSRSGLRFLRSASSAMPRQLLADLERVFQVPVIEAYGMTEAGPQIASNRLPLSERRAGSVGRAAGPEIAILNAAGQRLQAGQTGEIAIRGPNVMRAYERPEEADDAFVDGWLRTGDLGYLDADGFLFVTGRLKEVINRGGEKISPREVEEVLLDHPAVAQAAVFPIPHPSLGEGIAAAVVLSQNATATEPELRLFAATRLASFKAPQRVVMVDKIPAGPTGKLERAGLAAALGLLSLDGGDTGIADPCTAIQQRVAEIWASVLRIERPGLDDDFFRCGGHSLSAMQVLARLRQEFGVELESDSLFAKPTVAELSGLVSESMTLKWGSPAANDIRASPLSFAQERLWFLDQMEPGNPAYNICSPLWLTGALDQHVLEESLQELRRRHETLRTTFAVAGEQPIQVIAPAQPMRLPVVDLTDLPAADREAAALRLATQEAARPFDLAAGPLFRASLLRLSPEEHALLLTAHHIVSDGWSTGVLYRELAALYRAFRAGQPPALLPLPMQYAGFAAWQRERLRGKVLDDQLGYWKRQLSNPPPAIELPMDRPRPAVQTFRGARTSQTLSSQLTGNLKELSLRESVTLFMTTMAAFQTLLFRYSGQEDLLVGIPVANRTRVETEPLIGFFANTLALRGNLSGDPTFRELLGRTKAAARGAYAHQDLPFEKLIEALQPERDPGRMPLFQVMFAFQNVPDGGAETFELGPGLAARPFRVDGGVTKFDLTVYLWDDGQCLHTTWQYSVDLFDAATIRQLASHFQTLLAEVAADPGRRLSEFRLPAETERLQLEIGWTQNAEPHLSGGCFHRLFEQQAERTPGAVALESGHEQLSYRELNAEANRVARHLRTLGVHPEERVAICLPRSTELMVAVLGVLKAGGAYVALDPDYPPERLAFMLKDSGPRVLITETALHTRLRPGRGVAVACLDTDRAIIAQQDTHNVESGVAGENLAYIIYTSGSMGTPKGVMVTHANLYHCARAMGEALTVGATDRYLHTASFGFSSSVRQFSVPLGCGAALVMALSECILDPRALFALIRESRISVVDIVPSYWRACIQDLQSLDPAARAALLDNDLRLILSASERLPGDLPHAWASNLGHRARMINMYGQTETTGIVTVYPIPAPESDGETTIPVGLAVPNTRVYVLDRRGAPVPAGVTGEVFVGGSGVARGYFGQPELTAARFVPGPFRGGERMYRTGDLARYRRDGALEFLGRADDQVKVRGYRIEPGEIEVTLRQHPQVRECAVLAQDREGYPRLVAFVAPFERGAKPELGRELHALLKRKLPDYMAPGAIVEVDALPRTPSGKVDRSKLATRLSAVNGGEPRRGTDLPAGFRAPGTPSEKALADIWRELLQVERVSAEDNFFDLGGDSLLSVRMIRQANQAGLPVSLKQLFQHQTVAELARAAGAREGVHAPAPDDGEPMVYVTLDSLRAYGREALDRAGLNADGAAIVTEVQLEASLRGQPTHSMDSIPRYARRIAAGAIQANPCIRIERETRISAKMDGDNGPGQWVATVAMETAIRKARQSGVGVVSVRRSNHFGAAGHYVWLAARQGLIGLCTTNGPVILAPTGGLTPTFGNNPLAAGIPAGRNHPIILDIAMSVAPRGKIGLRLAEGKPLPQGWILDRFGQPSTDPADLAAGLGVPIGGHKGYGLALVMEALAGVLPGAGFGRDHRRERMGDHSELRDLGHFFIVIDPELFSPSAEFTARVDRMIEQAKSAERMEGVDEILIPGEAELRARERNLTRGVPLRPVTYRSLLAYAASARLSTELVVSEVPQSQ